MDTWIVSISFVVFFFLLRWVFVAARGLSLVARSRGYPLVAVRGLLTVVVSPVSEHGF